MKGEDVERFIGDDCTECLAVLGDQIVVIEGLPFHLRCAELSRDDDEYDYGDDQ